MTQALKMDEQLDLHKQKAQEYHSKIEEAKKSVAYHTSQAEKEEKRLVLLQQIYEANHSVVTGYTYILNRPNEDHQRVLKFNIDALNDLLKLYENSTQETQK